jgi:hypothetical protein
MGPDGGAPPAGVLDRRPESSPAFLPLVERPSAPVLSPRLIGRAPYRRQICSGKLSSLALDKVRSIAYNWANITKYLLTHALPGGGQHMSRGRDQFRIAVSGLLSMIKVKMAVSQEREERRWAES